MKKSLLMWLSINIISIFLMSCNAERNNPIGLKADNYDEAMALSATSIVISGGTEVNEGSTGTLNVKLKGNINISVTVNITSSDTTALTVSPATLTFTPENWNVDQAVTLTAPEDSNYIWENVTITASSTIVSVSVIDNETNANGYYDNGDGTIFDGINNLIWMKCSQGQTNDATCTGTASNFQYCTTNDSSCDNETILTSGLAYDTCNDLNSNPAGGFAGRTTWRVPTKDELKGLVYCDNGTSTPLDDVTTCGSGYTSPTIDQTMFPNTVSGRYWSSTPIGTTYAWYVFFYYGNVSYYNKDAGYYVRCLSPGP